MITQSTNVNLIPRQISPRVHVSQYDKKSRTLSFTLYNGSQPFNIASGMAVTIEGTKPDHTGFQYAMTSAAGSNVVSMSIEQQMTVLAGEIPCEIVISSSGKKLCSANFILVVEAAALRDDTIISETELPLIEEAAELAENIAIYIAVIDADALKAEGYAVGKQNGTDVGSGSPYFHNNAKYHAEQAASSASTASTKASEASTSATNAASSASTASTKASQASTSATNAATSATNAANSASTASTKASEASTSASTASTKAGEAAASAQAAQQAAASLTVDSQTSTTSTNPVQNKVITAEVNAVKETLTNEVTTRATLGAHNLLVPTTSKITSLNTSGTWSGSTYTIGNLTIKVNDDFTFNINGSHTARVIFALDSLSGNDFKDKYVGLKMRANGLVSSVQFRAEQTVSPYSQIYVEQSNPEKVITDLTDSGTKGVQLYINIPANTSVSNITVQPMMLVTTDTDTAYRPYVPTNSQLLSYKDNGVLGAKNLLPRNVDGTLVRGGVTFTANDDGTITLTNTSTAVTWYTVGRVSLSAGTYRLSGCPAGGSAGNTDNTYRLAATNLVNDIGNGAIFTLTSTQTVEVTMRIGNNTNTNGLVFKPMITLASDTDPTYVPYAKSNKQLTEDTTTQDAILSSSVVWDITSPTTKFISAKKYGKVVTFYGYFRPSSDVSIYSTILHGLPKCAVGAYLNDVKNQMSFIVENQTNDAKIVAQAALSSGIQYFISGTYICE